MKTKFNFKHYLLAITMILFMFGSNLAMAQTTSDDGQKKIKIKVTVTENGKTTTKITEIIVDETTDVETILREMGVFDDIDLNKDGENVMIIIKKSDESFSDLGCFKRCEGKFGEEMKELHKEMRHIKMMAGNGAFLEVYVGQTETIIDGEGVAEPSVPGALITGIIEGTAAEAAGLMEGDIITSIGGQNIDNYEMLVKVISQHKPGDKVEIEYLRNGTSNKVELELGSRADHVIDQFPSFEDFEMPDIKKEHFFKDDFGFKFEMEDPDAAFLGIRYVGTSEQTENGFKITSVVEKSTAEEMGLQAGDIINKINGQEINNFEDLVRVIKTSEAGSKIQIEFTRDDKKMKETGTLKSRKESKPDHTFLYFDNKDLKEQMHEFRKYMPYHNEVRISIRIEDISADDASAVQDKVDIDLENSNLKIELYFKPNPSGGQIELNFTLQQEGNAEIFIMDNTGRRVYHENLENFDGSYQGTIDFSDQPSGVYFLTIRQDGKHFSKKLVKY
ncbi:MAG: PDZ domain-containing protein [Bacteroidetes bacterium]|nr:PDZ domain-containing protein [Bacteroidota bacterium]